MIIIYLLIIAVGFLFLYGSFGWIGVLVVAVPCFAFIAYDHIKYPNKFRGNCGYCGKNHGRVEWWNTTLGQSSSKD